MKFQNRLASVLTSTMLAMSCVGTQSAIAASNLIEKTGMTKLFSCSADELGEEGQVYEIPENSDRYSYYLYYEYKDISLLSVTVETTKTTREYVKQGNSYVPIYSKETQSRSIKDRPSRTAGFRYDKLSDADSDLVSFRIKLDEAEMQPESSIQFAIYGYKKTDTPDPSLSEITGTTTGTVRVGGYAPDYDPWFTNENGDRMNRGTNAYWNSVMRIESYPQRLFALGEQFNTAGLKVILTENRSYNSREHDISDCLQIRTDYDPETPGEYLVYIRTDYTNGEVKCDDYLFYTVFVDGDLTTGPETEHDTTVSESRTTADTTETETTVSETTSTEFTTVTDDTELLLTETTESVLPASTATDEHGRLVDEFGNVIIINGTSAVVSQDTGSETALLKGDVDCSGQVQIADAVLLARYVAEDAVTVTAQGLVNAELDGEAGLTAGDLSALLQGIAGNITL